MMRPTITVLLVLLVSSMLATSAFAECAAMNMPCCAQHHNTNCHEICVAPTANISTATAPEIPVGIQPSTTMPTAPFIPQFTSPRLGYESAPPVENLLARIHVLLL